MLNKLCLFVLISVTIHLLSYLPGCYQLFENLSLILFNMVIGWQLAAIILNNFYRKWFIKCVDSSDKIVLVTGCDTGFGRLFARFLNKKGYHVFASCLNKQSCEQLNEDAHTPDRMISFVMDITKDEHIDNCFELVQKYLRNNSSTKFWALINNAGIACPGELEFGQFDQQYRTVFEVNTFAMAKITRKFLPLIRAYSKSKSSALNGRLININSLAGRCAITPTSIYSMSKHASVAFTEALRNEMYKFNIKVISVEPYYYETMQTNCERLQSGMENSWKNTDLSVREDYGLNYEIKLKNLINDKDFRKTVSKSAVEVAEKVYESLSSHDPEDRYVCASGVMKIGLNIFNIVPREFVDLFVRLMQFRFGTDRVD